jgi:hypothetical protein
LKIVKAARTPPTLNSTAWKANSGVYAFVAIQSANKARNTKLVTRPTSPNVILLTGKDIRSIDLFRLRCAKGTVNRAQRVLLRLHEVEKQRLDADQTVKDWIGMSH